MKQKITWKLGTKRRITCALTSIYIYIQQLNLVHGHVLGLGLWYIYLLSWRTSLLIKEKKLYCVSTWLSLLDYQNIIVQGGDQELNVKILGREASKYSLNDWTQIFTCSESQIEWWKRATDWIDWREEDKNNFKSCLTFSITLFFIISLKSKLYIMSIFFSLSSTLY